MEEIKNNSLLESIEKQITDLISLDKKNWTNFYTLLKKVETEKLWEEKYNSFTQWLKDFSNSFPLVHNFLKCSRIII